MRGSAFALCLVAVMLVSGPATAQAPSLEVTVPAAAVRVGDRVELRVATRGGEGLLWGELGVAIEDGGPWALVDGPRELEGASPPVWELTLAPMEVGNLVPPPIGASVRNADARVLNVVAENVVAVDVASVLPDGEDVQAVGLRDPVGVGGFPWEWVLPVGLPLLAVAGAAVWWGRRRRRPGLLAPRPALEPLPELEAVLSQLEARVGREPAESICDRLAVGLRHYLGHQSGEPAADMTSFELRLLARGLQWPESVQRGVQDVMNLVDRVRFGKAAADDTGMRGAISLTRNSARELDQELAARLEDERAATEATG